MPRVKVSREVGNKNGWRTVEVDVNDRDVKKVAKYSCFADFATLLDTVSSAGAEAGTARELLSVFYDEDASKTEESAQALLLRYINASIDRIATAAVRESIAQESTFITTPDGRVDIMTYAPRSLVRGINGMRTQLALRSGSEVEYLASASDEAETSIRFGPWKTAAKRLVESGKAKEGSDGKLELVA